MPEPTDLASVRNLANEIINTPYGLPKMALAMADEIERLREYISESCCLKTEANKRIADAQAEAAKMFTPEIERLRDHRNRLSDMLHTLVEYYAEPESNLMGGRVLIERAAALLTELETP